MYLGTSCSDSWGRQVMRSTSESGWGSAEIFNGATEFRILTLEKWSHGPPHLVFETWRRDGLETDSRGRCFLEPYTSCVTRWHRYLYKWTRDQERVSELGAVIERTNESQILLALLMIHNSAFKVNLVVIYKRSLSRTLPVDGTGFFPAPDPQHPPFSDWGAQ